MPVHLRHDSLGRRIPEYDRSAAGKKGAATRKKLYGENIHKEVGAKGGHASAGNSGYFNRLKESDPEKLKEISSKGVKVRLQKSKTADKKVKSTIHGGRAK